MAFWCPAASACAASKARSGRRSSPASARFPISASASACRWRSSRRRAISPASRTAEIYGSTSISERHRHRYEVNTNYLDRLAERGFRFCGMSPDGVLPETVEMDGHPWFVGVQFHPELKSRPFDPHPLFASFIEAAVEQSRLV